MKIVNINEENATLFKDLEVGQAFKTSCGIVGVKVEEVTQTLVGGGCIYNFFNLEIQALDEICDFSGVVPAELLKLTYE